MLLQSGGRKAGLSPSAVTLVTLLHRRIAPARPGDSKTAAWNLQVLVLQPIPPVALTKPSGLNAPHDEFPAVRAGNSWCARRPSRTGVRSWHFTDLRKQM